MLVEKLYLFNMLLITNFTIKRYRQTVLKILSKIRGVGTKIACRILIESNLTMNVLITDLREKQYYNFKQSIKIKTKGRFSNNLYKIEAAALQHGILIGHVRFLRIINGLAVTGKTRSNGKTARCIKSRYHLLNY